LHLGFRIFYQRDLRPWIVRRGSEVHEIFIGPGWGEINGYEKVGRVVCGTLHVLVGMALCLFIPVMILTYSVEIWQAVACLFKPICQ